MQMNRAAASLPLPVMTHKKPVRVYSDIVMYHLSRKS